MTKPKKQKHVFCLDVDGISIRKWATLRRAAAAIPDGYTLSPTFTGKKPRSARLRKTWDEVQAAGKVSWTAYVYGAGGRRIAGAPTLRDVLIKLADAEGLSRPRATRPKAPTKAPVRADIFDSAALHAEADRLESRVLKLRTAADALDGLIEVVA